MPLKIYVPFLNIGSVPCAKALKKAPKMTVGIRRRTKEKVQYCITAISST